MKTLKFMLVPLLMAILSACATTTPTSSGNLPPPDLRSKYIYAVERASETRATRVYWVNPPTNEQVAALMKDKG